MAHTDPSLPAWQDRPGMAAFLVIVVLLGLNFVMVRFSNRELDPFWGATLRFIVAAVLLAGVVYFRRTRLPRGSALLGAVLFGTLSFAVLYGLLYLGMLHVTPGLAAVLFATIPLATLFFAALAGLERVTLRGLSGALLAVVGIAMIFHARVGGVVPAWAFVVVLVAALSGAAAGVIVKRAPRADPFGVNLVAMTVGAVLLAIATGIAHDAVVLPRSAPTYLAVAWLVGSTVCAFVLMVWLIGRWNASRVAYTSVLAPIVALVGGHFLDGEPVGAAALAGAGVVLAGVYVGVLRRSTPGAAQQPAAVAAAPPSPPPPPAPPAPPAPPPP